jgi:hypothetical protein
MDDMGTPGPNHPAHRGLKDKRSENQFDNVLDLAASRKIKERTGKGVAVKLDTSENDALDAHWDSVIREDK